MGLLETRLLDFDNIILTNVNEGILPEGKSNYSWIPFDVRKKFGIPKCGQQPRMSWMLSKRLGLARMSKSAARGVATRCGCKA